MFHGYPCTSGDDPIDPEHRSRTKLLSLHKRGWSHETCMFVGSLKGYPCTSGDDPSRCSVRIFLYELSLHKRGWSYGDEKRYRIYGVIPAQAGMIPRQEPIWRFIKSYPCTSGDDPDVARINFHGWSYPCTSGDDPILIFINMNSYWLSLHKRGWSSGSSFDRSV